MLHVVYTYVRQYARFEELKYSLRSLEQFLPQPYQIFIVGDRPEWLSNRAVFIEAPVCSMHAITDVVNKLRMVISDERIQEDFIWMMDDIYLLKAVSHAEFTRPKAIGTLQEYFEKVKDVTSGYPRLRWHTFQRLQADGWPTVDTVAHLPIPYNKDLLHEVLENYQVGIEPTLHCLSYLNHRYRPEEFEYFHNTRGKKAAVYSEPVRSLKELEALCEGATYFNHSDHGHQLSVNVKGENVIELFLKKRFPVKSIFEK